MGPPPACPLPAPSLSSSPQTLFSLLPLQALRAPGTQGLPSLPEARGGQDRASSPTPSSHWPEGQTVLPGPAATHPWGLPPLGHHAWGQACRVLFGWDPWFCKKLKKKKKKVWRISFAHVLLKRLVQGLQVSTAFHLLATLADRPSPGSLRSDCPGCCGHASLPLPFYSPMRTGGAGRG